MKQQPRLAPVALHCPLGHLTQRRDLAERQAAEEVEVHELGEGGIDLAKRVERVAQPLERLCGGGIAAVAGLVEGPVRWNSLPRFLARRRRT